MSASQIVVITGASAGVGAATARAFARKGARLGLLARGRQGLEATRRDVTALGCPQALAIPTDVSDAGQVDAAADRVADELGPVDVWVNNAGADVLTGEAAAWEWERKLDVLLAVDLKGTIACSYAIGEVMRGQDGGGAIVNMSWDHVTTGMAGENPQLFAAVKGGVLAFSKCLARSLAPDVRVNVLCPGWVETSFGEQADPELRRSVERDTPLGRWGRPQDVAHAALYLASPEAAFLTGQAINVNGGVVM